MSFQRAADHHSSTTLVLLAVVCTVTALQRPVSKWTTADVAAFMGQLGRDFEAVRFACIDGGVDGKTLMLLQRADMGLADSHWRVYVAALNPEGE